jgi:hypothetical protein
MMGDDIVSPTSFSYCFRQLLQYMEGNIERFSNVACLLVPKEEIDFYCVFSVQVIQYVQNAFIFFLCRFPGHWRIKKDLAGSGGRTENECKKRINKGNLLCLVESMGRK